MGYPVDIISGPLTIITPTGISVHEDTPDHLKGVREAIASVEAQIAMLIAASPHHDTPSSALYTTRVAINGRRMIIKTSWKAEWEGNSSTDEQPGNPPCDVGC